jgi:hypothetical protein
MTPPGFSQPKPKPNPWLQFGLGATGAILESICKLLGAALGVLLCISFIIGFVVLVVVAFPAGVGAGGMGLFTALGALLPVG